MNKDDNMYTNVYRKLSGKVKYGLSEIDYDSGEIEYCNKVYDLYTGELKFHILEFTGTKFRFTHLNFDMTTFLDSAGHIEVYHRPEVPIERIVLDITLNNL